MMKITTEIMEYGYAFLYERYRLPLYVTECGLSCNETYSWTGRSTTRIGSIFCTAIYLRFTGDVNGQTSAAFSTGR